MDRIIAGRFETKELADSAAARMAQFVVPSDICIFHNNPPGQHDAIAGGGDAVVDDKSEGAGESSAGTAAAGGAIGGAIGALGGPLIALAAAGTGAYVGSLAGALAGLGNHEAGPALRPGGVFLAVRIEKAPFEERVIGILQAEGAADVEEAEGVWQNGDWIDFNPAIAPKLVQRPSV